MKTIKLKFLALILIVSMMLLSGCTLEFDNKVYHNGVGYAYNKLTDSYNVYRVTAWAGENVTIPESINGKQVTSISSIDAMFNSFSKLKTLILPDSIQEVQQFVYKKAPEGFQFNEYDNGLYLGTADNPYYAFIKPKYIETAEEMSYKIDEGVNEVIKETEPSLPYDTNGSGITECVIHPDTKIMASNAFAGCLNLKSVTVPGGIKVIPQYAFAGCSSLESVIIEEGVETIGEHAFMDCDVLSFVSFPSTLKNANMIFGYNRLFDVTLEVKLADGLEAIPDGLFCGCYNLKSINIPKSVKKIGDSAFDVCINLENIDLSENLEYIGDMAFAHCQALTSITLPNSLKYISLFAIYDSGIEEIKYNGTIEEWKAIHPKGWNSAWTIVCIDGVIERH